MAVTASRMISQKSVKRLTKMLNDRKKEIFLLYLAQCLFWERRFRDHIFATRRINDITFIFNYLQARAISSAQALVVFDIDENLVAIPDIDHYEKHLLATDLGETYKNIRLHGDLVTLDKFQQCLLSQAPTRLMERHIPDLIASLQQHIKTMALTAMPAMIDNHMSSPQLRAQHLKTLGLDFSNAFPISPFWLGNNDKLKLNPPPIPFFEKGILFSGFRYNISKGEALCSFLETIKFRPAFVLFVDDKLTHVHSVRRKLGHMGIDCYAIRYVRFDPHHSKYKLSGSTLDSYITLAKTFLAEVLQQKSEKETATKQRTLLLYQNALTEKKLDSVCTSPANSNTMKSSLQQQTQQLASTSSSSGSKKRGFKAYPS